jgi:hypothetical protein
MIPGFYFNVLILSHQVNTIVQYESALDEKIVIVGGTFETKLPRIGLLKQNLCSMICKNLHVKNEKDMPE